MSDLAALAAALPKCAATCMLAAVKGSTCAIANQTNQACVCHNEDLNAYATACITASCTIREALFTKNLTSTSCGIAPTVDHIYVTTSIIFVALSAICILLRVTARLQAKIPVWWDDFIITLSFVLASHGLGSDIWAVSFDDITLNLKGLYTLFILYITSRDLVRLSILLFYLRIFGESQQARRLIQFTFVLILACCIAFDFAIIFGCTPINHFWTSWDGQHEGRCISTNGIFWAGAFVVIAIDLWVMLIPLPFIVRLNFSLRKKILSAIMFTFGIFVIIVSLYRLKTINRFTLSKNPTLDFVDVGVWSGLELYVGIICACLPNFHSLLKPVFAWMDSRLSSRTTPSNHDVGAAGGTRWRHSRLVDTKFDPEPTIRATTTVNVAHHHPELQGNLHNSSTEDNAGSIEHIELGQKKNGETIASVWV
ncbi:hypothetical protein BKA67DRAFT_541154 [Truncatella angustata]|uniref:CFEM domain-containing protein n=1 Tax=Truncatella angustata TaxID=152316 RepID=A0A9P8RHZ0_9PEZI|nr:uncharacterized protein BKA67DRAFT_541154 [Truncatella angustata]KAH6646169.1 hypothetical protein BKA67DRAFT_541154 [Truncatella angustata]